MAVERVSFNELAGVAAKAARGGGCPAGLAEDVARAVVWLCRNGSDGAAALAATTGDAGWVEGLTRTLGQLDTLVAGGASEPAAQIGPRQAALALGLAGAFAAETGAHLRVSAASGTGFEIGPEGPWGALPDVTDAPLTVQLIGRGDPEPALASRGAAPRAVVDAAAWRVLLDLAHRTYVPASVQSRLSGAGAGLSDND